MNFRILGVRKCNYIILDLQLICGYLNRDDSFLVEIVNSFWCLVAFELLLVFIKNNMKLMTVESAVCTFLKKIHAVICIQPYPCTTVLYNIYCPKSDGSVILLGWSSVNARPLRSVSRATIVLPCMAMTDKSESLSVVIVDLSQVWSLRRQENDLLLPKGTTASIFSSSTEATDSSGIAACLFQ